MSNVDIEPGAIIFAFVLVAAVSLFVGLIIGLSVGATI